MFVIWRYVLDHLIYFNSYSFSLNGTHGPVFSSLNFACSHIFVRVGAFMQASDAHVTTCAQMLLRVCTSKQPFCFELYYVRGSTCVQALHVHDGYKTCYIYYGYHTCYNYYGFRTCYMYTAITYVTCTKAFLQITHIYIYI